MSNLEFSKSNIKHWLPIQWMSFYCVNFEMKTDPKIHRKYLSCNVSSKVGGFQTHPNTYKKTKVALTFLNTAGDSVHLTSIPLGEMEWV